jgi:aminopeptidase N
MVNLLSVCFVMALQPMDTRELLEQLASAESKTEIAALEKTSSELNEISSTLLKEDNLELIALLQRALENYNEFSDEKTEPFVHYYKHYQSPLFLIPNIELTLDVKETHVGVVTRLAVERNSSSSSLVLNGVGHKVAAVFVNGAQLNRDAYRVTPNELIILKAPTEQAFTVTIESEIDPYHNPSLEGLYASGPFLTTQCESEGARRIFYTLDRPDVLSRITTTIVADDQKYPYRLSNGNLIGEERADDGRAQITWEDPIPKPSYLFACVLGDFGKLQDFFTTRSGRKVSLEVYLEKGKEARGVYSLYALKKAMQFDEDFFDREYDLDSLKMVAAPDFNMGAMENKGLLIFNDRTLLVDQHSGTDANFQTVAIVVAHEYFHNWSGNRVTVRNWFELALKEAFTDFRSMLFGEWLYGSSFIRPKDVTVLKERQFPQESTENGHPIMVDSYVNASSIYDATTYVKGREVFRSLQTYLDMVIPDGFRKAQNLYYERYDGQAVTFRELLSAANEVLLKETGKNLAQFERWFSQQGTPQVSAEIVQRDGKRVLSVTQSCVHPRTGEAQEPLLIPFSYELLRADGTSYRAKQITILTEKTHSFEIDTDEALIPIFMHDYSAPVSLKYPYTLQDLSCILQYGTDPYSQWEAGKNYSLIALLQSPDANLMKPYKEALSSKSLAPLAKAQLLQLPSIRALSQKYGRYDFAALSRIRENFLKQLADVCKPELEQLLVDYPEPARYETESTQMQIRELRKACLNLLSYKGADQRVQDLYFATDNFDTSFATLAILAGSDTKLKTAVINDFYNRWKGDKMVFNHWLAVQAGSSSCTVSDLKKLLATPEFDKKNPNHVRSVLLSFATNLGQYHDPKGEGYAFLVDQIIATAKYNPLLAYNYLAVPAFVDFDRLPASQKELMARELKRLLDPSVPPELREMAKKLLEKRVNS